MSHEQPGAEDGLSQDIENGVGDDLAIDRHPARTVANGPDAGPVSVSQAFVCRANERAKTGQG